MISSILIAFTVAAALIWGGDFLWLPQWQRVAIQVGLAAVLFGAVAWDWSRRD